MRQQRLGLLDLPVDVRLKNWTESKPDGRRRVSELVTGEDFLARHLEDKETKLREQGKKDLAKDERSRKSAAKKVLEAEKAEARALKAEAKAAIVTPVIPQPVAGKKRS